MPHVPEHDTPLVGQHAHFFNGNILFEPLLDFLLNEMSINSRDYGGAKLTDSIL